MSDTKTISQREVFTLLVVFFVTALFFIAVSVYGTTIGTEVVATTHVKATSTVQATGNIFGYANLLVGGTTTAALSVDFALGGTTGTLNDAYISGALGVANATTADGDFVVGTTPSFSVTSNGRMVVGASTTAAGTNSAIKFIHDGGDAIFSSGGSGTTTVGIVTEGTAAGGCIEMTGNAGLTHRIFINAAGNGITVEAGSCSP